MNEIELLVAVVILVPSLLVIAVVVLFVRMGRLTARIAALEAQRQDIPGPLRQRKTTETAQTAAVPVEQRGTAPSVGVRPQAAVPQPPEEEDAPLLDEWTWEELEEKAAAKRPFAGDLIGKVKQWLLGGNTVARIGTVLIFFGVGFLLKHAAEIGWLPIELRLAGVALGGMVLTVFGWWLRGRRRGYALILQGGGIGVIYLTVYATFALYNLVPAGPGLGLMVALVAMSSALAVLQDARSLAILAVAAGFLAPVLMSKGGGSHVVLFSYYALLNAGILAVAWYKAWRELNLLGFAFTFGIGAAWGFYSYQPEHFATTEPFLVLFFLFYVAVPILFAERQPPRLKGYVDGSLVFGVPLVASVLQSGLVHNHEYGLAISALVTGLFYTLLATALWSRRVENLRLLTESFVALAVVFGTLAIPLAVDGRLTGAAWALEGAALVWVGVRQQRLGGRLFGVLVQAGAGIALVTASPTVAADTVVLNSRYFSALMIGLSGLFSAYYLYRNRDGLHRIEAGAATALLVWGLVWWLLAGTDEISRHLPGYDRSNGLLVFFALSAALLAWLRRRLDWQQLVYPPLLLLPAMVLIALELFFGRNMPHPFSTWGMPAWGVALAVQYGLLKRFEEAWTARRFVRYGHLGALWLAVFLLAWEAGWALDRVVDGAPVWGLIAWGVVPAAVMGGLPVLAARADWPVRRFSDLYLDIGQIPLAGFLALWALFAAIQIGTPRPLSYLPVLNPLELTQLIALFAVLWRARKVWAEQRAEMVWYGWSAVAFVVLNGMVARATHFLGGVPFDIGRLWDSPQFQTAVSVTWSVAALAVTLAATRLRQRPAWFAGVVLLGAVVVKLFLVDLAEVGTVARIVSFLVVGGLVLLIGYVSPLPPGTKEPVES